MKKILNNLTFIVLGTVFVLSAFVAPSRAMATWGYYGYSIPYTVLVPPPAGQISVGIAASNTAITIPGTPDQTTLTWVTGGSPTSCAGSGNWPAWIGPKSETGGSQTITGLNVTGTYTFTITCEKSGATNTPVTASVNVVVNNLGSIGVELTANPMVINLPTDPAQTTLTWTTQGSPTSCQGSGEWSNTNLTLPSSSLLIAGAYMSYPGLHTFNIICHKAGLPDARASAVVQVNSINPVPAVSLFASPSSLTSPGGTTYLSWVSQNLSQGATCTGQSTPSNSVWNVSHPINSGLSPFPVNISVTTTFRLQCTGGVTGRTTVVVLPPVPVNGVCAPTHWDCNAGTSINNTTGTSSWTWSCEGSGGGTTASCSESIGNNSMYGTITPLVSSCEIPPGASTCDIKFTWATTNPIGISSVTSNTPSLNTTIATGNNSSGPTPFTVFYPSRSFFLYNSGTQLDSATVTASCQTGSGWNTTSGQCVSAPNSPTASLSPDVIPVNQNSILTWSSTNTDYCDLYQDSTALFLGNISGSGVYNVTPTSLLTRYILSCVKTSSGTQASDVTTVSTLAKIHPIFQEPR